MLLLLLPPHLRGRGQRLTRSAHAGQQPPAAHVAAGRSPGATGAAVAAALLLLLLLLPGVRGRGSLPARRRLPLLLLQR